MKIYKALSVAAGLAFIAANVSAQASGTTQSPMQGHMPSPQQMAQRQTDRIKQGVTGITPDQEKQILAVEQNYSKGMQDAMTSSNGDRAAMHSKMEPLRTDRDSKIKSILTPDQFAQYQKMGGAHRMATPPQNGVK